MSASSLDKDGQERLARVLTVVNGNIDAIRNAVFEVIGDLKGEKNRGRRIYLRNEITRQAREKIREDERKKQRAEVMTFKITPTMRLDAYRHEQLLMNGIPDHDR